MMKAVRQKKWKKKRVCLVGVLILLLAAAGITLHRLSLSLQDIGRIVQFAAGKTSRPIEEPRPENKVLRGQIFDRNYKELAVSYQLFSLFVNPVELSSRHDVAKELARINGDNAADLAEQLKNSQVVVKLADDLDDQQARAINTLGLKGVTCKAVEERYYPSHAIAGHLLGFTGKGTGLSGVEARYNRVLQPGEFRNTDIPEVDLADDDVLGQAATDVVLTVDLDLQKTVEQQLRKYRSLVGAAGGSVIVLDIASGQVLAMASQPGFDPNYFWQSDPENLKKDIFSKDYDPALIRPLLLRAAAIYECGMDNKILPATVRAPDYGLKQDRVDTYNALFSLGKPVKNPLLTSAEDSPGTDGAGDGQNKFSAAQLAVGVGSLLNGGKRVSLNVLQAIYDLKTSRQFMRSRTAARQTRILDPAAGIFLRRSLLLDSPFSQKKGFLFTNRAITTHITKGLTNFDLQEGIIAAVPKKNPKILLVMLVEYNSLYPHVKTDRRKRKNHDVLVSLGKSLLPVLSRHVAHETIAEHPARREEGNYRRFLISRRLDLPQQKQRIAQVDHKMPDLQGMSLRQGLQHVSSLGLAVRIKGSGHIVEQHPAAGEYFTQEGTCELTLESRI